ncbi:uncharacterized protein LY89DRAFT_744511 [Mollisia scopiformis]|uniref:Uncharacterized protein n=1 Tax=Mollisia scopiformis TaxID=149040 RepID=A0A194XW54_MOLSC|nr:uncharacterized protein LY89DRAFT_744511 [Mollisia scopiformis]KUJ23952.1 hypothetical protein LY89DRAFT_744511 [Mollisia scopiformis]
MAVNILVLGLTGILSIPALTSMFSPPVPDKILINIGVGANNSQANITDPNLGGNTPSVALFDVNGVQLGFADGSDSSIIDGGTTQLSVGGAEGSSASETPEYVQLYATGDNAICIAWLTTTSSASDGGDFRTWNGATATFCGLPWYPSTALFPGVETPYTPPCFWMSSDGRFVDGFSARLTDFFFPGNSGPANSTSTQWAEFPDTLCKAPGRQQFYNSTGSCIPFYPSGLSKVNDKDPETGFDIDFEAIESSFTMSCSSAGTPFNNNVDLGQPDAGVTIADLPTTSATIDTNPSVTIPAGVTLQSSLELGNLKVRDVVLEPPSITAAPEPKPKRKRTAPKKEPVLNRRVEKRSEQPHQWCEENKLVVSDFASHSAIEVCVSETSWGPDFVSTVEAIFCDMCQRRTYPLCGENGSNSSYMAPNTTSTTTSTIVTTTITASLLSSTSAIGSSASSALASSWTNTSSTASEQSVQIAATSSAVSNEMMSTKVNRGETIEICFDLEKQQLRAPKRLRRTTFVPVKEYTDVQYWS